MKNIIDKINESHNNEVEFRVAFMDTLNEEEVPFTVTILVESKYKEAFKKYLEKELNNSVFMAEDWNGDLIGED